jgi:hypothetical protein
VRSSSCTIIASSGKTVWYSAVDQHDFVNTARINLSLRVFGLRASFAHRVFPKKLSDENKRQSLVVDASCDASQADPHVPFPTEQRRIQYRDGLLSPETLTREEASSIALN